MDDVTDRFALPLIQPGQAQKEMFHNEAIIGLELRMQIVAAAAGLETPPLDPQPGEAWIIGAAPQGEWTGHAHALAGWSASGWRFAAPVPGMLVWVADGQRWWLWNGTGWRDGELPAARVTVGGVQVVGARQAAIAAPAGSGTVDAAARGTIAAILSTLRAHGLIAT